MNEPAANVPIARLAPEGHNLLAGKTVLITAAAGSGIGSATARRCVDEGATVMISDRHEPRLAATADELGVASVPCDVTSEDSVQAMFDAAVEEMGHVDVLINNAGLGGTAEVHEMTDDQWSRVLDVTLNGTFRCTRAALALMYERGSGVIINNASVLGWRAQVGQAHYAAAKAGVMALTRCSGVEAAPRGVRINAVAPSLAMHENLAKVTSDELLAELSAREAFGRPAETWEIASVIAFLASDYSSYLVGETISVSNQRA